MTTGFEQAATREQVRTLSVAAIGTALALSTCTTPIATLVSTASGLGSSSGGQAWILNSMSLGLAVGPLPTGAVGDDYGRRRMFGAGAFGLAASSVAAALAQDTTALVLARIGQGLAVAAILSSGLGLIGHASPPGPRRLQATGVWGACLGAGIASRPLLAGALDAGLGWRRAYWLITVLSAVLGALSWLLLTESSAERRHPVDLCGMLLLGAALVSVLAGLVEGRAGWGRPPVVGLLAVSVVLGGVFAVVALHRPTPMLDLRLFARPDFARARIAALATGAGVIANHAVPAHARAERPRPQRLLRGCDLVRMVGHQRADRVARIPIAVQFLRADPACRRPARVGGGQAMLTDIGPRAGAERPLSGLLVAGAASGTRGDLRMIWLAVDAILFAVINQCSVRVIKDRNK
jgi:MFS family permease